MPEKQHPLDLIELRFATQMHDSTRRSELLEGLVRIAGGGTITRSLDLDIVAVSVPRESEAISRVHELCRRCRYWTKGGLLHLAPLKGAGIVVPLDGNPDARGQVRPLFEGGLRSKVRDTLVEALGRVRAFDGIGAWIDDDGRLVTEPNELWHFPESSLTATEVAGVVQAHLADHPVSDQSSYYVSVGDQAGLIERSMVDAVDSIPEVLAYA